MKTNFKIALVQALVFLALSSSWLWLDFSFLAFCLGFLFAQTYGFLFLFLASSLFKGERRALALSVTSFKWLFLGAFLYVILQFTDPLGFFMGLLSLPSFFITFAILRRE